MKAEQVLELAAALAAMAAEFIKLVTSSTTDPEDVRQALLRTQRIASDALARHDGLIP